MYDETGWAQVTALPNFVHISGHEAVLRSDGDYLWQTDGRSLLAIKSAIAARDRGKTSHTLLHIRVSDAICIRMSIFIGRSDAMKPWNFECHFAETQMPGVG